jgi:SSS family transporter
LSFRRARSSSSASSWRFLASGLFIFRVSLWLAAATYAPALALEKVTGIPLWITIIASGTLTTLYTALGGMRAVIWTDVIQLVVLFGGQLVIALVAASKIPGGLGGVWETALADGRMDLSLSFAFSERVNLGSVLIAAAFLHLVQMATDQVSVQRYLTAGSLAEAKRSLWIKLWFILPVIVLFYGTGLVLYAFYKIHGDPLAAGLIQKEDQILPYFVVTQLPAGLPGLLIAAIYAASMSTISAGLNSLSSATVVDFKQRLSKSSGATDAAQVTNARWITVAYGLLVMLLAFAVSKMPGNLVESVNTVIAIVGGPLLGLFFLGMFTKRADTRGALTGCLAGFLALISLYFYQIGLFTPEKPAQLVSFIWFSLFGALLTVGVGLLVSQRRGEEHRLSHGRFGLSFGYPTLSSP